MYLPVSVSRGRDFIKTLEYLYFYIICIFLESSFYHHSIPFWLFSSRHVISWPDIASFFFFSLNLNNSKKCDVGCWDWATNLIIKEQATVLTKYLETCQNLVAPCHICLIHRLRINVLFQSCVWKLALSKMIVFMSCTHALWCYWNILIAFMNVFNEFH